MKRNEILGEQKKGVKAVKYNKKPKDHSAEYGKAKEKLAPVKPMEGYNPNSASAEHRRKLDQSHAADLKARAEAPDASERDQQRYQNYLDKKEQMRNDYNDRMEREGIEQEALYRSRGSSSAYDRDKRSSETGFGRRHDHRDLEHELGHETNNYAVAIDGRTWKVFASRNHAEAVARSLQNKGKKATVHETGAEPTAEATGAELGKITKVDPATKKATLTKPDGTSMEVDSTALKPTPDGKMSIDTPDTDDLKAGTAVVSTEDMSIPTTDSNSPISGDEENVDLRRLRELAGQPATPEDDGDYNGIDSAESYKAWLQKSAADDGLSPEDTAGLVNMLVTEPDGSIDMDATMVKTVKAFADLAPQLYEMFSKWVAELEKAKADPAQWSAFTPEEQKSIDAAIAEGKAQLPVMKAEIQKMQDQMPELDKTIADRKAAGTTMKIPAKAPVEEGELDEAGEGMSDEYLQKIASGAPGRYMISQDQAKAELARRASGGTQKVAPSKSDADSDSEPFVPKDYQTKEPLKKGPDGKWYNSNGEERDGLHGGPINPGGGAMFRSMKPRTPTPEAADNELLQKMLSIAGLR